MPHDNTIGERLEQLDEHGTEQTAQFFRPIEVSDFLEIISRREVPISVASTETIDADELESLNRGPETVEVRGYVIDRPKNGDWNTISLRDIIISGNIQEESLTPRIILQAVSLNVGGGHIDVTHHNTQEKQLRVHFD